MSTLAVGVVPVMVPFMAQRDQRANFPYLVWFSLVLWHINHCRLFNAKSSLYIYIKYIGFGLVGFYGISTIVGYLLSNPFLYIYFYFKHFSLE